MITRGPMSFESADKCVSGLRRRGYALHDPLKAAQPGQFAIHSDGAFARVLINPTAQDAMLSGEWDVVPQPLLAP